MQESSVVQFNDLQTTFCFYFRFSFGISLTQWTFVQKLKCPPDHMHMLAETNGQITDIFERTDLYGKKKSPIKP